ACSRVVRYSQSPTEMLMAATQVPGNDVLEMVRQMPREEFDAFLEKALSLRTQPTADTLSPAETRLIKRINRGLSVELCKRYARLTRRRKKDSMSAKEREELLKLTHEIESRDAERAAALVDLAKLRRLPVRVLMKQLGIEAPPIRG